MSENPEYPVGSEKIELTEMQKRFVDEYLIDLNATQASIRAGYSPASARQMGYENLTKPYIERAIKDAMDARAKRCHIRQDYPLRYWIKQMLSPDKEMKIESKFMETKSGEQTGMGRNVYKVPNDERMKASENIAKHLGMFVDKHQIEGGLTVVNALWESTKTKKDKE